MLFPEIDFPLFAGIAVVAGLVIGSFLNVVIHRLPIMMAREISEAAREQVASEEGRTPATNRKPDKPFSLCWPPSSCPICSARIAARDNVPVIGYLLRKGRCANCGAPISPRYPLIEAMVAVLFLAVAWQYGAGLVTVMGWIFVALVIAQSAIDLDHKLLPDELVYLLLWAGLLASLTTHFADPETAIIGAVVGYGAFSVLRVLWLMLFGEEALGLGDAKMAAALGAWFGWQSLPIILLLAAVVAIVATVAWRAGIARNRTQEREIAFGPYLGLAGTVYLLFGADLSAFLSGLI